jgi:type IV pilus assembly protein PilV
MYNHSAFVRSQANIFAFDMLERIRLATSANLTDLNSYSISSATFNLSSAVVTSPRAAAEIDQWRRNIATNFPSGKGAITCVNSTRICTIEIAWDELNASGQASEDSTTFTYTAKL